ncbi:hydrolase/acyltransferase [Phyllosticta capitalensis]|uniref:Hydrolase/acyltransferase n=1 Tax=Phyllosticta capitalensis TaxID=121624 RepID=A0ABR1YSL6_9PEZI
MWNLLYFLLGLTTLVQSSPAVLQKRQAKWEFLPKTPTLPDPFLDTRFEVDGVSLWLNEYNKKPEVPLVFLHGGLGSSEYWADVVKLAIDAGYYCILVDLRGHGRSSYLKDDKFTYELYAKNVFDLLNSRNIGPDYVWIGWSDGAAATLAALLDPTIGRRLYKAFVFAGFQNPSDTNPNFPNTAIYKDFVQRCQNEYPSFNKPGNTFEEFAGKVAELEKNYPQFTDEQLGSIPGGKVGIAGADKDEAVNLDVAPRLNRLIKGSSLSILKDCSHFCPVQDPPQMWDAIKKFLDIPTPIESSSGNM